MQDNRFLNMREAGSYLGQTYRWMQRNYLLLIRRGVVVYRVPRDASKGRLMFEKKSLDAYMATCRLEFGELATLG